MTEHAVTAALPEDDLVIHWDDDTVPPAEEWSVPERAGPLTELARALTGVGTSLAEVSWPLALASADQAVTIYRDLLRAGVQPPADLGNALSQLLTFITELGTYSTVGQERRTPVDRLL